MVYLIRHAHAGAKREWDGPDGLRPLSGRGLLQAATLVDQLAGLPVERILSSPTVRCRQTVEPLATVRGLGVDDDDTLAVGAPTDDLERLLADPANEHTVVCTHGESIGELFEHFGDRLGLPDGPRWQKGSIWLLDGIGGDGGRPTATYLPPQPGGD